MAFDIKGKIEEITKKVTSDKNFQANFTKDPIKAVEGVVGVDLPDDVIHQIVDGVKTKVNVGKIGDALGGLFKK